ncbi:MAG: hypothetical protein EHM41_17600 [Chloroflexi bacterium]|nr:MAG: hypothetical protein EHM41_17600 [Chloroflexota bacterium]
MDWIPANLKQPEMIDAVFVCVYIPGGYEIWDGQEGALVYKMNEYDAILVMLGYYDARQSQWFVEPEFIDECIISGKVLYWQPITCPDLPKDMIDRIQKMTSGQIIDLPR